MHDTVAVRFTALTQDLRSAHRESLALERFRADGWRDEHTRSAIAFDDSGEPVAVGMIWTSRVHGDRYWCEIEVAGARRRQGIGSEMFEHLGRLRAEPLRFMTRGFVDEERIAFADALGARTIQVVPPVHIGVEKRSALRSSSSVHSGEDVTRAAIEAANAQTYEWTHADWSPVGPGFGTALNEDLWDELDREATSVALDAEGVILAMAMAYTDSTVPVITSEAVTSRCDDGERLVEGCIRRTLDVFAQRGVKDVQFDGHVSDPHFMPVLARLEPTGRWFRLVEIPAT